MKVPLRACCYVVNVDNTAFQVASLLDNFARLSIEMHIALLSTPNNGSPAVTPNSNRFELQFKMLCIRNKIPEIGLLNNFHKFLTLDRKYRSKRLTDSLKCSSQPNRNDEYYSQNILFLCTYNWPDISLPIDCARIISICNLKTRHYFFPIHYSSWTRSFSNRLTFFISTNIS